MTKKAAILGLIAIAIYLLGSTPRLVLPAGIVSSLLLMVSHWMLSRSFEEPDIAKHTLLYFLLIFTGSLLSAMIIAKLVQQVPSPEKLTQYQKAMELLSAHPKEALTASIALYVSMIVGFYFLAKAYHLIAFHSQISLFARAGNMLFYGSMGIIVLGIGFLLMTIGWILAALSYYQLMSYPPHSSSKAT